MNIDFKRIRSVSPVIVALLCFMLVASTYSCNSKAADAIDWSPPTLTPAQKISVVWAAANAFTAITVGWIILPAVTIAGKQKTLCDAMHGKYDPKAKDLCEGGDWVRIIPFLSNVKE
jgi:hypothetical protein